MRLYNFYIDCSNRQFIFTDVDLLSSLLGRSLLNPRVDGPTPLGVAEVLTMEDLEFPILLDKSEDGHGIEVESVPAGGSKHTRGLCRGYVLCFGTT